MNKRKIIFILFALIIVTVSFTYTFSVIPLSTNTQNNTIIYHFNDDYKSAWKTVDSLENKGLTRSALEVVDEIYKTAKLENNEPQIIKSLFFKLKYANYVEEYSHQKIIKQVTEEIDSTSFPANAILKSILANIYWQYYQNNRWRYQQRTETVNFDNDDFETWDLPRLIREIVKNYRAA